MADLSYHVLWSRHLLSFLCGILGADLLVGARAVVLNPHFLYFFSPDVRDSELGSVQSWPAGSVLLLLDSFEPTQRAQILLQASNHRAVVWVLSLDQHSVTATSDLLSLRSYQSRLVALLPLKSLVLHPMSCWQDLRWDSKPSRFSSQLRQMRAFATGPAAPLQHSDVQSSLGCWQQRRYDFHLVPTCTTRSLLYYRAGQEDARLGAKARRARCCCRP